MKKFLQVLVSLSLLFSATTTYAQYVNVSGVVTAADDQQPLFGVSVVVKGTTKGTITDIDGKYSLSVPEKATLVFSFIGFSASEQPLNGQSTINVVLKTGADVLNEVVVTGFGSQIKRELTGNIARLNGKDIENMPVSSVDQAIQGKAAGVYVNSGGGKLGQAVTLRIRGNSSISASSQPLFVVDGTPVTVGDQGNYGGETNPLADINPNDIESLDILKDASAGAIYGARAANGVVLITTKRGKAGKECIGQFSNGDFGSNEAVAFLECCRMGDLLSSSRRLPR
jgi:TonB-dependent starch-binding outer membrane protein SusC